MSRTAHHGNFQTAPMGDWTADALCVQVGPELFFAADTVIYAKRVCQACQVRTDCLAWALAQPEQPKGIWGGLGDRTRRRMAAASAYQEVDTATA